MEWAQAKAMNSPKPTLQFVKGDVFKQEESDLRTTGFHLFSCVSRFLLTSRDWRNNEHIRIHPKIG